MGKMKEYLYDYEVELREQIAKEIESGCSFKEVANITICLHCQTSANIARGNK